MKTILIKNAKAVNEGRTFDTDLLIKEGMIERVDPDITSPGALVIDANGTFLLPGVIDDQVHFREPGLTHKGTILTESRSGIAGGTTSYIEQPNTIPNAVTHEILEQKYTIASQTSYANYSFMLGGSNNNIEEVKKLDPKRIAGVKVFMGSSTGNMLVDNTQALEAIFTHSPAIIAVHCEDEATVRANLAEYKSRFGEDIPVECHPLIRSEQACYLSSSMAVALARKTGARLHVFHLSTAKELQLFDADIPLHKKKITAEACLHHLWFSDADYPRKGNFIKWNPAVKTAEDREALWRAVHEGRIDVFATDHAPHTLEEKSQKYSAAPSGGPLVQHALSAWFECVRQGRLTLEKAVEMTAHNPAILFEINRRGFIREGYHADLVLVDANRPWQVSRDNVLSKCGWSPFEGTGFSASVTHTFVNGNLVYENGVINQQPFGQRLLFDRS
jgi:dihydroorotase